MLEREDGEHAVAQVFLATEAKTAAATVHDLLVLGTDGLADSLVKLAENGDRRLRRRSTGERAEHGESEQRFLHCDYLLG